MALSTWTSLGIISLREQRVDLIQITYRPRLQTSQENVLDKKQVINELFRLRLMFAVRHQLEVLIHLHPGRYLIRDDVCGQGRSRSRQLREHQSGFLPSFRAILLLPIEERL